jgi:UDP-glucuronate 4-epimerase
VKVLITGVAGFIGFSLAKKLSTNKNFSIVGIDNLNTYYDNKLKESRLKIISNKIKFSKIDICNKIKIYELFKKNKFDMVIHLAAQAGVRFSITNPEAYIKSNLNGFFNIIETSRQFNVKKFIYASSSSVYGDANKFPLSEYMKSDQTVSLYASTKKSNEMIANNYFQMYNFKSIGLRFFTVYGPYGRPDMAMYKFTKAILENKKLELFNYGNHYRDFTYIDDVIQAISNIVKSKKNQIKSEILNIGYGKSSNIKKLIKLIEENLKIKAKIYLVNKQKGDVLKTFANVNQITKKYNYNPKINLEKGIKLYLKWYLKYYKSSE